MSLLTLRQHPFFLVLTLLTAIAFLDLSIHVQPTQAYNPQAIIAAIERGVYAIGAIAGTIALYLAVKKDLDEKIEDAEAEKSKIEGKIQAHEAEITTLKKGKTNLEDERKSKYATIDRCEIVIEKYKYTSESLRPDEYDMAVADKKEAEKAIKIIDARLPLWDSAIDAETKEKTSDEDDLKDAETKLKGLKGQKTTNDNLLEDANQRIENEKSTVYSLEQELPLHENHAH